MAEADKGNGVKAQRFEKKDTQWVKGIAVVMLIIHHCFLAPERYEGQAVDFAPFTEGFVNSAALSMKICVALFTFLSAYGITMSYKNRFPGLDLKGPGVGKVMVRRLKILLSNYIFIFLLVQLYDVIAVRDDRYHFIYGHGLMGILHFLVDGLGLAEMFEFPTYLATFWYMSLAILVILMVPVLILLYKRIGGAGILLLSMAFAMLFPVTNEHHYAYLPHYLFCVSMGIICAERNIFTRIAGSRLFGNILDDVIKCIGLCALTLLLICCRQQTRLTTLLPFWDGLIPITICSLSMCYFNKIPGISQLFQFLGKHSMNIFLIHNFIRIVWYYDFTYSFEKWWLIALVLLGISLLLSIVIEAFKRVIKFPDLINRLTFVPDKTDAGASTN